jgi:hypothetical protein
MPQDEKNWTGLIDSENTENKKNILFINISQYYIYKYSVKV